MRLRPPGHRIPPLLRKNIITSVEAEKLFKMYSLFVIALGAFLIFRQILRLDEYLCFSSRPQALHGTTGLLEVPLLVHNQSVTVSVTRGRALSQVSLQYARLHRDMTPSVRTYIRLPWILHGTRQLLRS